jgi:hypothetical protein
MIKLLGVRLSAGEFVRIVEFAYALIDLRLRAFAGLLALHRLDVLREKPEKITVYDSGGLFRELAASWTYVYNQKLGLTATAVGNASMGSATPSGDSVPVPGSIARACTDWYAAA